MLYLWATGPVLGRPKSLNDCGLGWSSSVCLGQKKAAVVQHTQIEKLGQNNTNLRSLVNGTMSGFVSAVRNWDELSGEMMMTADKILSALVTLKLRTPY